MTEKKANEDVLGGRAIVLFLLLIAFVPTIGYQYGHDAQLTELLLANTFLADKTGTIGHVAGPSALYVSLISMLEEVSALPVAALAMTISVNGLITWISYQAARRVLHFSQFASACAAALFLCNSGFSLGAFELRFDPIHAGSISAVFTLVGVYFLLLKRPAIGGLGFIAAALVYPIIGFMGAIIAFTSALVTVRFTSRIDAGRDSVDKKPIVAWLALFSLAALFWGVTQVNNPLSAANGLLIEFISQPRLVQLLNTVVTAIFFAAIYALVQKFRTQTTLAYAHFLLIAIAAISGALSLVAAALLIVFGEIISWATLLIVPLYLVKWCGFLLIGWQAALWMSERNRIGQLSATLTFAATGNAQPLVFALILPGKAVNSFLSFRDHITLTTVGIILLPSIFFIYFLSDGTSLARSLLAMTMLFVAFLLFPRKNVGLVLAVLLFLAVFCFSLFSGASDWVGMDAIKPSFALPSRTL